jgi:hypothetical protein
MPRPARLVLATALLVGCKPGIPTDPGPVQNRFVQTDTLGDVTAMAQGSGGHLWLALDNDFALRRSPDSTFEFISRGGLPAGQLTFLGTIDGSREWLFANVHGQGFFRNWANSDRWDPVEGLTSPLLQVLRPGLQPIPTGMITSSADGVTWLSTIGGLYFTSDEGVTWDRADTSSSGDVNIVFTDVDAANGRVVATALLPEGLIPEQFAGVLGGRVFVSDNSGLTWTTPDEAFTSNHPTSVAVADDGTIYVGTMDDGVVRGSGDGTWTRLFGPTDVTDVEWTDGGLSVASATRGLWRLDGEIWTQAGRGGAVGVTGGLGVLRNGEVYDVQSGAGEPPPDPANGEVHLALSFYVNYHHSTRGDAPDESGFGQDIRVLSSALDWLDAHPDVRADWVFENHRTLDDRMPAYSPQLLDRIAERVRSGKDDVRLMSYTASPMASLTTEEAVIALDRAKTSLDEAFGTYVLGVQPSDSMVSPDNIGLYADEGIEWMSLYYGANGFTGPRNQITLDGAAAHNPFLLTDPVTQRSITTVPVYHHGDLLDHGGLEGWARQLNANHDGDTLLTLHFDADAESWENFDRELADVLELPFVRFTTIDDYVTTHPAGQDLVLSGDVANGAADGFGSWSHKASSQELWTVVEQARRFSETATFIASSSEVEAQAREATLARLELLATDNFGLTAPSLNPARLVAATADADEAHAEALQAYRLAVATAPALGPQELEVLNPTDANARTTVPFRLRMPAGAWEGEAGLVIERGNALLPIRATFVGTIDGRDVIDVEADVVVTPFSRTQLVWSYDPGDPRHVRGDLTPADLPSATLLQPPFVDCADGRRRLGTGITVGSTIGEWGLKNTRIEEWSLPSCLGGTTELTRRISRRHDFQGTFVEIEGTIDAAADTGGLVSMVLAPITCPSGIDRIRWPSYAGTVRSREVPQGVTALNPVSADGWIEATCGDGSTVQIALDQTVRSAMGMLTFSNRDDALLAPLGAIWGGSPWHDGARTGGTGMADLVTPLIGSQFQPSAPDWAGTDLRMRMWITTASDQDDLRLFATPPLVRSPDD